MDKKPQKAWWAPGVMLFTQLSAWIVFPIICGVYFGYWLDDRFQTGPKLFIIAVAIAFIISNLGIIIQGRKAYKKMQPESQEEKPKSNISTEK